MRRPEATRLYKDDQGAFHWVYCLPMYKNLSILRTIRIAYCTLQKTSPCQVVTVVPLE